jgi:protease PrsW
MAFCRKCGAERVNEERFCGKCGADWTAAAGGAPAAAADSQGAGQAGNPAAPAPAGHAPAAGPPSTPPGMVPVVYQAYPGGPQQVYYVPAQGARAQQAANFLEAIQSRIRAVASTEKLEGFSLKQTFSETFKRHGEDAEEEYLMVGSARTTPPIELVDTNWPKPWMFFRLLALLAIAAVVLYIFWIFTTQLALMPTIAIVGSFSMPVAVLVFVFEMNTPRNVSWLQLVKLFLIGAVLADCMTAVEYMNPTLGKFPGIMEETAKLAGVLVVMRGTRYKYELNGILFGCAVGAGFGSFETTMYAFLKTFMIDMLQLMPHAQTAQQAQQVIDVSMHEMAVTLVSRGLLLGPFAHVVWTAIAAGAFWRVKQDRPFNASMLLDKRFLMAFALPVAMHTLWDISILFPSLGTNTKANIVINYSIQGAVAVVGWYVLFTMIQQGLHQVKEVQKAQLQAALAHAEATMQPVLGTYAVQPQGAANP